MDMPTGRPLTFYEREQIESFLRMKKTKRWIANKLHRDYSIIKREIKRNSGAVLPYTAVTAEAIARRRSRKTNVRKLEKVGNENLAEYVTEKLNDGWSPEQIEGTLKEQPPESVRNDRDTVISYESIYDWIYNGEGRYLGLYKKLRRKQKERIPKFSRNKGKKWLLKERVSIHQRPRNVDERAEVGHWETDSVIFSGASILSVQFERKTKVCRLHKCENKSALASEEAVRDSIDSLPRYMWQTITRDNGLENALHHETEVPSYFCDPYSSWQKGGVENLNGLIREYFPKKSNLDTVTDMEVYEIQEKLNNRPRKALNFLTPNQALALW